MKSLLTPQDIANNVRMMRAQYHGAILIVEGGTDMRVYEPFVDEAHCKLTPACGKENAIGALDILEKNRLEGVLVIVDADFWRLDGTKPNSPNLLLTDTHDLETMILSSDALEKVTSEFASPAKISKLGKPIRDILLESAAPIGFFRWLSSATKDNLCVEFKKLAFDNFVDRRSLKVDIDKLIREAKVKSQNPSLDASAITRRIAKLETVGYDLWQVCSGHDLVQILSIGLKSLFGNRRAKGVTPQIVDGMLRVAYEYSHFCYTQLYASIKSWSKANQPYEIL